MSRFLGLSLAVAVCATTSPALAGVVVSYTADAGGENPFGPSGLSATATFQISGSELTILLENTSTGVPAGAEVSDSLLVSLAFDLGAVHIDSGDSALIGPGSVGLGSWSALGEGDDVGDEWLWTNDFGGDLLEIFPQVISTSQGQGGGDTMSFNGEPDPGVSGPFGGIAAAPPLLSVPGSQRAVSDSIFFTLTLSGTISDDELFSIAQGSVVEFGSDFQYLAVPAPGALSLLLLPLMGARRRRS